MKTETFGKVCGTVAAMFLAATIGIVQIENARINDLELQRDIYKSRFENWSTRAMEMEATAENLQDQLEETRRAVDGIYLDDAGEFFCTAYCCEQYEHICGTGTGITASGAPVKADLTVAADQSIFPYGTILYIEDVGICIVQDKGTGVQGNHLDVAVSGTHADALNWNGYGEHRVWVVRENRN